MFLKTVIRQGNKLIEQNNMIKQYEEENQGLRDEIDFMQIDKNRLVRNLKTIIEVGEKNKDAYYFIIKKKKKELADCESH